MSEATATEHRVELPAGRFRYLRWGSEANPPLVLLHGRTGNPQTWEFVADRLAERWQLFALEQRGHGESPWDAEGRYDLADFLGDYEAFVERVLGGRRHALIGHSMGACTSLVAAARHPEWVTALVLDDGGPLGPTVEQAVADDRATSPDSFASWADARRHLAGSHGYLADDRLDRLTDLSVRPGAGGRYYWRSDVRGLLAPHFDETMQTGMWDAVPRLEMETLFFWATDPYLVEPEVARSMVEMNPRIARVDVPTGHMVHEERPDLFLDALLPFLERHGADRP